MYVLKIQLQAPQGMLHHIAWSIRLDTWNFVWNWILEHRQRNFRTHTRVEGLVFFLEIQLMSPTMVNNLIEESIKHLWKNFFVMINFRTLTLAKELWIKHLTSAPPFPESCKTMLRDLSVLRKFCLMANFWTLARLKGFVS